MTTKASKTLRRTPIGDLPEWLTVDEYAAVLDISVGVVYESVKAGDLPVMRIGRGQRIRIHRDALRRRA